MMSIALKFLHSIPLFNYFNWHKSFGYDPVYHFDGTVVYPALHKPNNVRFEMKKKFTSLEITYKRIDPVLKSDAALWKCFGDQVEYFDTN